ncbi:MAG: DMT family transporter [Rickettsiales bacterium]
MHFPNVNQQRVGLVCAALAALGYAIAPTLAKLYYASGGNGATFIFLRALVGYVVIMPFVVRAQGKSLKLSKPQFNSVAIWSCLIVLLYIAYFASIYFISVSLAVLLFFLYPTITLLFEHCFKGERVTRKQAIGMGMALVGVGLILTPDFEHSQWLGIVLAGAAAVLMALDIFIQKRVVAQVAPSVYLTYLGIFTSLFLGGAFLLGFAEWEVGRLDMLAVAIALTVLDGLCLGYAIKYVGSVRCAMIMNLEPLFVLIIATIVLDEQLSWIQYIGGSVVILALYIESNTRRRKAVPPIID